jgi:nucleoside-diphosphate-sugar epimerase
MGLHVIVGAGPVGSAVAAELLAQGEQVRVVTRSGSGIDGVEKVKADASDATRLSELACGAEAIYNCVNPIYYEWATTWPPIAAALIAAAESSGAILVTTGNLYGYGEVDAPMTERTPLNATGVKGRVRNQMTKDAFAAHEAGRIRTFEVRGSDYLGGNSVLSTVVLPAWKKGRTAYAPCPLDVPHTWTDVRDVAALMVVGVKDERAWGKVWHVPSTAPKTFSQLTAIAADQLGVANKVRPLPYAAIWVGGLFNPFVKELRETQHQFRKPYILDSSAAQQTFGLTPHPIEDSVRLDIATGKSATG